MAAPKKKSRQGKVLGAKDSRTRAALVDAAGRLMVTKGYAAMASRTIAEEAGVAHQLIFYYFESLDDLLVEVFRTESAANMKRMQAAIEAEQPLRALWDVMTDERLARVVQEFIALANHNDNIRAEISGRADEFRDRMTEVVAAYLERRGIEPIISPRMIIMLMSGLGRMLVNDAALGYTNGHAEARALVEACLGEVERTKDAGAAARKILPRRGGQP